MFNVGDRVQHTQTKLIGEVLGAGHGLLAVSVEGEPKTYVWYEGNVRKLEGPPMELKVGDRVRHQNDWWGKGTIVPEKPGCSFVGRVTVKWDKGGVIESHEPSYLVFIPPSSNPLSKKEEKALLKKISKNLFTPIASDPPGQRSTTSVHCGICNKEYSGEQIDGFHRTIIGGARYQSPTPNMMEGTQPQEITYIGPCCARKVDAFILELKTKTNITTERKNATNSWMPHDEDGNL